MIKTLFFDIYQTLIDVDIRQRNIHNAWKIFDSYIFSSNTNLRMQKSFEELVKIREEQFYEGKNKELHHRDFEETISEVFQKDYGTNISSEEIRALIWRFRKLSTDFCNLYPHVKETLRELSRNYILATASLANASVTIKELEVLGIKKYFSQNIISSAVGYRKPSKEFFDIALKMTNTAPNEAIMIGDNLSHDIVGAKNVGMWTILVENPTTIQKNPSIVPDGKIHVDRFEDLVTAVKKIEQDHIIEHSH